MKQYCKLTLFIQPYVTLDILLSDRLMWKFNSECKPKYLKVGKQQV